MSNNRPLQEADITLATSEGGIPQDLTVFCLLILLKNSGPLLKNKTKHLEFLDQKNDGSAHPSDFGEERQLQRTVQL